MAMETIHKTAKYWLVDHPTITNFEWKRGTIIGSSPHFLIATFLSYIFLTLIFSRSPIKSPPLIPLRLISTVHNLLSFSLSVIMAVGCMLSILSQMPNPHWIICFPANHIPPRGPVFFWGYIFYMSKILEFTDTLLIILSGTHNRRLSFLHVFHHSHVLIMAYIWVDTAQSMFPVGVVANAVVHTVMYCYYLMCSVGIRPSWKRLVTKVQIIQFVFAFVAAGVALYYHLVKYPCSGPVYAWSFGVAFNTSLLLLFVDFYDKTYKNKNKLVIKKSL